MGGLLQHEKMDQITTLFAEEVFNFEKQVIYFPVRHHSPACSYHLQRTIAAYKPEIILLEGPENSDHLIDILTAEKTKPPVSIYYGYATEEHTYVCYYPFLDYSPEYVALKEAAQHGIPAKFIDLSYGSRLESLKQGHDLKKENKKLSYHDETLLTGSSFIRRLCEKMKYRTFDELWEAIFEIEGIKKETPDFVRDVFAYCYLSRMTYEDDVLEEEGNFVREAQMKRHIEMAKQEYTRILVVTGGFHTYGLIEERNMTYKVRKAAGEKVYPMVYTFAEADQLNGYASGMPFVNYYDKIWQALCRQSPFPYTKSNINLLAELLHMIRKKGESVSVADAIEANDLIGGLASLRSKREGGAYELLDAVTSAFTKGERSIATSGPLEALRNIMTGNRIGEVAPNELDVPIVRDFKSMCKKYRLHIHTTGKKQKMLDVYAKALHRDNSRFFHCLQFLGVEFCEKESGPDWANYKHINLVREGWTYSYSSSVEARLIENSVHGGSIREAAIHKLEGIIKQVPNHNSCEAAKWLLQAILMGLEEIGGRLFVMVEDYVKQDSSFLSLCQTFHTLTLLYEQKRLFAFAESERIEKLISETYYHAVSKIYALAQPNPEEIEGIIENLKRLYMVMMKETLVLAEEIFHDQLGELLHAKTLPPQLEGAVAAILFNLNLLEREEIVQRARAYMFGTTEKMMLTARYLQGVFMIARDVFLYDEQLLADLDYVINGLSYEDFLQIAPELKLAFTYFSPMEIITISENVANLYQTNIVEINGPALDERMLIKAKNLDRTIRKEFARWNLV